MLRFVSISLFPPERYINLIGARMLSLTRRRMEPNQREFETQSEYLSG